MIPLTVAILVLLVWTPTRAADGRILVSADDWVLTNQGFISAGDTNTGRFATNLAKWFVPDRPGRFLASPWFGAFSDSGMLIEALTRDGHSWTKTNALPQMPVQELLAYDALFLGDQAVNPDTLEAYVHAGGNVYVYAIGHPDDDARVWNPFLSRFGLGYSGPGPADGPVGITNAVHPLFAGVNLLYFNNGTAVAVTGNEARASVLTYDASGRGLLGVYDPSGVEAKLAIVQGSPGSVLLEWVGAPQVISRLWRTESLNPPVAWSCIVTNVSDTSGKWQVIESVGSAGAAFYKATGP